MEIKLDKFELDILSRLEERTGKTNEDIIKLALYEFEKSLDAKRDPEPVLPQLMPQLIPYPVYPQSPFYYGGGTYTINKT